MRFAWLAVLMVSLAGCVSVQNIPLAPTDAEALRGREVAVASREQPDFMAMTAGRAAIGGLIGAAIMTEGGRNVVTNNSIQDPAALVARTIGEEMKTRYQLRFADGAIRIDSDDPADIARAHPAADVLLEVRTITWGYAYYPTQWNRYRVLYSARLRLIDAKKARVLAEGFCSRVPDDAQNAPNGDELLAHGAQIIKNELRTAADFCLQHFRTATFALGPSSTTLAAAPAPAPAAVASAPVMPLPAQGSRFPRAGDKWTYRLSEPKRIDGPKTRTYVAQVASASPTSIVEKVSVEGGPSAEFTHTAGAQLVNAGSSVLSPYLAAFQDPASAFGRVQISDPACSGQYACQASVRAAGRETIRVQAGSFETIKLVVEHSWRPAQQGGHPVQMANYNGTRELTVWYAPQLKRAVKFSSRLGFGAYPPIEADFELELVSYEVESPPQPVAAAPAAAPAPAPAPAPLSAAQRVETVFWENIRSSNDAADFNAYLEQYPNGRFAAQARERLAALGHKPAASATPVKRMPSAGDQWTYRLFEPQRTDGPKERNYVVKIASASDTAIVEQFAIDQGPAAEWTHKGETQVMALGKPLFSPYLLVFQDLPRFGRRVPIVDPACGGQYVCEASARVVAWEKIRVAAGTFDTMKIEVTQSWRPAAMSGQFGAQLQGGRTLTVWYAHAAKRAVKFSSRSTFGTLPPIETDFELELVSYKVQ